MLKVYVVFLSPHFPKTWCAANSAEYRFKDIPIKEFLITLCLITLLGLVKMLHVRLGTEN